MTEQEAKTENIERNKDDHGKLLVIAFGEILTKIQNIEACEKEICIETTVKCYKPITKKTNELDRETLKSKILEYNVERKHILEQLTVIRSQIDDMTERIIMEYNEDRIMRIEHKYKKLI